MPFGSECEYPSMAACVEDNQDKDQPDAFCATLMRETEEHCQAKAPSLYRQKLARLETKVISPTEGTVRAVVSTEDTDRDGDIIRVAGWQLDHFKAHPVLVSSHDYGDLRNQIGEWVDMGVRGKRLEGTAQYMIGQGNEQADWAFNLAKQGRAAYSVGFIPDLARAKELTGSRGAYEFNGQELLEVSQVVVPSNRQALQRMKSLELHPEIDAMVGEMLAESKAEGPEASELIEEIYGLIWPQIVACVRAELQEGLHPFHVAQEKANIVETIRGAINEAVGGRDA